MTRQWYYSDGQKQSGPVAESQFRQMIAQGAVQPVSLVWAEGMDKWVPLRDSEFRDVLAEKQTVLSPALSQTVQPEAAEKIQGGYFKKWAELGAPAIALLGLAFKFYAKSHNPKLHAWLIFAGCIAILAVWMLFDFVKENWSRKTSDSTPVAESLRSEAVSQHSRTAGRGSSNAEKASIQSLAPGSDVPLWNPNAAVNWSILLGVPLGSFLHARNWRAMGDRRQEKKALIWFWVTAVLGAACFLIDNSGKVYVGVWLWSLILWYFTNARTQTKYVQQEYGSSYPRKGFAKPLLIAWACYMVLGVVGFSIDIAIGRNPSAGLASMRAEREPAPVVPPGPASTAISPDSMRSSELKAVSSTSATVKVERLALGSSMGADNRVTVETTTFSPEQTIYASVETTGVAPAATMSAKWVYRETGQLVTTASQVIAHNNPAVTWFYINKPNGWPVGSYQVQIYIDNMFAAKQDFNVLPPRLGETAAGKTIVGKCLLEVLGRKYIDGRCPIFMDSDGSFQIRASENEPLTYFATVSIVGKDVGDGHWNEESGASHAHTSLGSLRRNGACWENEIAKVCATKDSKPPAESSPSQSQEAISQEEQAGRGIDADSPCPTTFEAGRWSSVENEHGVVMTAVDGEKLYIGRSCDVASSRFGNGRWAWSSRGVFFQFETCRIGWPRGAAPMEDNGCQLGP